mgnify:CR=1 FL=1
MKLVSHPDMRSIIRETARDLIDEKFQATGRFGEIGVANEAAHLDNAIGELLDITGYDNLEVIDDAIGRVFVDSEEAALMKDLSSALCDMIQELGNVDPEYYVKHSNWTNVFNAAHALVGEMDKNDKKGRG